MLFGFDEARAHLATSASILTEQSFGSPAVRYLVSDHMIRVVAPDDDDPALHLLTGWNPDGSNEHEEVA